MPADPIAVSLSIPSGETNTHCDSANSSMHEQVPYKPTGKWVGHVAAVCLCCY
jgi:hypothetical protein